MEFWFVLMDVAHVSRSLILE